MEGGSGPRYRRSGLLETFALCALTRLKIYGLPRIFAQAWAGLNDGSACSVCHSNSWGQFWRSKPRAPSYLKEYPKNIKIYPKIPKIIVLKIMLITRKLPHWEYLPCRLHFGPRLRCWSRHSLSRLLWAFFSANHSYISNHLSGMSVAFVNLTYHPIILCSTLQCPIPTSPPLCCCCIFPSEIRLSLSLTPHITTNLNLIDTSFDQICLIYSVVDKKKKIK